MIESALASEAVEHGLACFYLGDDLFSVSLRAIREINPHLDITPTRTGPSFVSGLINLRGQIVTVVDLGERLGVGARTIGPDSRLVILKTNSELGILREAGLFTSDDKSGLLVDRIADVVNPSAEDLEPSPPNLNGVTRSFLWGVCKTANDTIGILDTRRVLATDNEVEV